VALTSASDLRVRRDANQLTALAAVNIAQAAADADSRYRSTVENYQGLLRYDYFFGQGLAGFLSATARRDRFQGLALRLNIDPGAAYYFIDEKDVQLRAEAGYDLQHDIRHPDALAAADVAGDPLGKTATRHNARIYTGYDHRFSNEVKFDTSAEYIQGLKETTNWRLNWGAALTSQIADSFSISTSITVKYDHNPVGDVKTTDVLSAFSLVYTVQ
jgi:putative salt-induced outer membrane protein